jgi:hypothetical protein
MYLNMQQSDGGMRALPPEEGELEPPMRPDKELTLRSGAVYKKSRPKVRRSNVDVRDLTSDIENLANNKTPSASDAKKVIDKTRILVVRILMENKKTRMDDKNKSRGRHNSPHTSKKRPPKYDRH